LGGKLISAADALGTAAFIGGTEVFFGRDFVFETGNEPVYTVKLFT
jgi:hypothetical protein